MPPCQICGDNSGLGFTCNECGGKFCSEHRLPESHRCGALGIGSTNHSGSSVQNPSAGTTMLSYVLVPFVVLWWLKKPLFLLGLVVLGASVAPGIPPESFLSPSDTAAIQDTAESLVARSTTVTETAAGDAAAATQTTTNAPTTTTNADTSVSGAEIEAVIHARVNEIRSSRGLSTLRVRSSFTTAARGHSREMADRGELYHGDIRARYGSQCPAIGENVAQTYADGAIITDSGTVDYDYNETRIGEGIVRQWMNSPGHRDNILNQKWRAEGIGVYVTETDDGKPIVYATQGFCGG